MLGANIEQEGGGGGDTTPKWQKWKLIGVTFTSADATETTIFDGASASTTRVAPRTQIIYQKDVSTIADNSYSSVTFAFDPVVVGSSIVTDNHQLQLTSNTATHTETFKVAEGKDLTFIIKALWKNTVVNQTMNAPGFAISIAD